MKKISLLVSLFAILTITSALAQDFSGFRQSNYSGVSGGDWNPAMIADNRMVVDITLGGASFTGYNNHLYMNTHLMPYWWSQSFNSEDPAVDSWMNDSIHPGFGTIIHPDSTDYYMSRNEGNFFQSTNPKGTPRTGFVETEIDILNFMVSINRTMAISAGIKNRTFLNVDHVSSDLLTLVQNGLDYTELQDKDLSDELLNISFNNWMEYNAGFAMVVMDNEEHFLKVGTKIKFLQGLGSFYLYTDEVRYNVNMEDSLHYIQGNFDYGYSSNIDQRFDANSTSYIGGSGPDSALTFNDVFKLQSKLGLGADIGFVYEYRPKWADYKYDMDGETNLWRRDQNKYLLRVGFAVNDIGGMRYVKSTNSRNFSADATALELFQFDDSDGLESFNKNVDTLIANGGATSEISDPRTFYMNLPTHINADVDWHIWNDFYLNFNSMIGFQMNKDAHKVRYPTSFTLTPRYDFAWAGVAAPISYSGVYGVRAGLGLRMGPIIVGTGDMKWLFAPGKDKQIKGADVYFALKIPILYGHPQDIDNDKVSDKLDICLETPGVWQFMGCPDTDMDGIQDSEDACPAEPGTAEFQGCPDRDGDKIIDKNDDCPDDAGLAEFKGCPDRDGDKIMDKNDECPDEAGLEAFKGCPDRDGDGLKDSDDLCPEVAGPIVNQGCPDTDNDGIFDYLDGCPTQAGPQENNGCPWPDTDGDGLLDKDDACPTIAGPVKNNGCPYIDTDGDTVLDKDDECPTVPGDPANKGCPVIVEEDKEILQAAFDNLEFQTAKAIILPESFESLDALADLMIRKPNWRLIIAGHTDSQGDDQGNLILSKKRAEAVREYLVSRGIDPTRLIVQYYGETKPIDTNDTPEGRQKNRRVEMEVIFE
ncbi:MAG: OmpA family protein [Crocinitomicaceae bacterium]|nr:OmpA family protein [Crocinitomicaceae bacterium]